MPLGRSEGFSCERSGLDRAGRDRPVCRRGGAEHPGGSESAVAAAAAAAAAGAARGGMTRAHRRVSQQQSDSVVPSARRKSIRNAARASGPARSSCTGSAMRTVHRQIVWDELAVKAIDSHFVFGMIYPPVKRRSRSCRRKKCHSAVRQWQSDIFCLNPYAVHVKWYPVGKPAGYFYYSRNSPLGASVFSFFCRILSTLPQSDRGEAPGKRAY